MPSAASPQPKSLEQIQNWFAGKADRNVCPTDEWHRQSCLCELKTESESALVPRQTVTTQLEVSRRLGQLTWAAVSGGLADGPGQGGRCPEIRSRTLGSLVPGESFEAVNWRYCGRPTPETGPSVNMHRMPTVWRQVVRTVTWRSSGRPRPRRLSLPESARPLGLGPVPSGSRPAPRGANVGRQCIA